MPLDLVPPPSSSSRETLPRIPVLYSASADYDAMDYDDEEEKATLARFVPLNSEVRAILEDPEQTLAYMRKVQASIPDPDSALDSLVKVYEDRVERLAEERAMAEEVSAQAMLAAEERKARETKKPKKPVRPVDAAMLKLQPHFWKIVYATICCWGLLQLALTR